VILATVCSEHKLPCIALSELAFIPIQSGYYHHAAQGPTGNTTMLAGTTTAKIKQGSTK